MKRKCRCNKLIFLRKRKNTIVSVPMIIGMVIVLLISCTETNDKKQLPAEKITSLDAVLKSVSSNVLSKINIVNPVYKSLPVYTEALGFLDYDNYQKWDVSSRYSGRIEKLYVKYNYQPVKKGDILFEIYSPDLVTAEENLLYVLKNSPDDAGLLNATRQKLKLLQLTSEQIQQIENSGKIMQTIPVYSKYEGHIHELLDSKISTGEMSDYSKNPLLSIKEGMYVERGEVLFNIVNPYNLVAMLKIKSEDIAKVRIKDDVALEINNDSLNPIHGKINFIEPVFNSGSKTLMARVNVENSKHQFKVGSIVNAEIFSDSLKSLWIPVTAVVDLGKSKIVWINDGNNFKAQKVETGIQSGNMIEITNGLTPTDKIAGEGHFLSDSEGFIKTNSDE